MPALWEYMPSGMKGLFCDRHVLHGCSCVLPSEEEEADGSFVTYVDGRGQMEPCCEYSMTVTPDAAVSSVCTALAQEPGVVVLPRLVAYCFALAVQDGAADVAYARARAKAEKVDVTDELVTNWYTSAMEHNVAFLLSKVKEAKPDEKVVIDRNTAKRMLGWWDAHNKVATSIREQIQAKRW